MNETPGAERQTERYENRPSVTGVPLSGNCVDPAAPPQAPGRSSGGSDFLNFSGHPTLSVELPGRRQRQANPRSLGRNFGASLNPRATTFFALPLPLPQRPSRKPETPLNEKKKRAKAPTPTGKMQAPVVVMSASKLPRSPSRRTTLADMNLFSQTPRAVRGRPGGKPSCPTSPPPKRMHGSPRFC